MGIRNDNFEGGNDFTEEGMRPTVDLNPTIDACANNLTVRTLYTGTGLDISEVAAATSVSNSVELDSVSAAQLTGVRYLMIDLSSFINLRTTSQDGNNEVAAITLQIETKEIAGIYSDTLATTNLDRLINDHDSSSEPLSITKTQLKTFTWLHTLTNGEKTNGVQVQITIGGTTSGNTSKILDFTNKQIVLRGMN